MIKVKFNKYSVILNHILKHCIAGPMIIVNEMLVDFNEQ